MVIHLGLEEAYTPGQAALQHHSHRHKSKVVVVVAAVRYYCVTHLLRAAPQLVDGAVAHRQQSVYVGPSRPSHHFPASPCSAGYATARLRWHVGRAGRRCYIPLHRLPVDYWTNPVSPGDIPYINSIHDPFIGA